MATGPMLAHIANQNEQTTLAYTNGLTPDLEVPAGTTLTLTGDTTVDGGIDLNGNFDVTNATLVGGESFDVADFGSGAALDGYVATADGAGGVAWEAIPAPGTQSLQQTYDASSPPKIKLDASGDLTVELDSGTAGDKFEVLSSTGGADNFALTATGANAMSMAANTTTTALSSSSTTDVDAAGALSLNSSGGAINVGNDADAQNINIGTGAAARIITVGNNTGVTTLALEAGSGGLQGDLDGNSSINVAGTFDQDASGALSLNSSGGAINIGDDANAQAVNIATGAAARVITIGNAASASMALDAGVGGLTAQADTTMDLDSGGALSVNSSGGVINVGNDAVNQNINIGTAGNRTITAGATGGTTSMDIKAGSGGINLNDSTAQLDLTAGALTETSLVSADLTPSGALTLRGGGVSQFGDDTGYVNYNGSGALSTSGTTTGDLDFSGAVQVNSTGGAISIGNDADNQNVNVGTGGNRTITMGATGGTTAMDLKAGSGGVNINDSTAQLDLTSGALTEVSLVSADLTPSGTLTLQGGGVSKFGDDTGYSNFDGSGAMSTVGVTTMDLDSSGAMSLNSSAGAINVGNDAVNQNINIGTGGNRTVTVGATGGTTSLDLKAGSGGINMADGTAQIDLTAGAFTETSLVSADLTPSGTLTLQGGGVSKFGDDTGYTNYDGSGAMSTSGVTTMDLDSSGAMSLNSSAGVVNIANDNVNQNVNIGTAGNRTVTMGATGGTTSVDVKAGSGGINLNDGTGQVDLTGGALTEVSLASVDLTPSGTMTLQGGGVSKFGDDTGYVNYDGSGAMSTVGSTTADLDFSGVVQLNSSGGAINIGNDNVNQNINIGTNGVRTSTVGNTGGASTTALNSGTGGTGLNTTGNTVIDSSGANSYTKVQTGTDTLNTKFTVNNNSDTEMFTVNGAGTITTNVGTNLDVNGSADMTGATSVLYKADSIKDTDIDWGTGANQVSAVDMPIQDAGGYFGTDNVEAALQQLGGMATSGIIIKDTIWTAAEGTVFDDVDGVRQTQAVQFTGQPANNDTFTIDDGTTTETFTAKTSGAVGFQFNIGATINDTIINLYTAINANSALVKADYSLVDDVDATNYLLLLGSQAFVSKIYTWAQKSGGGNWVAGQPKYSKNALDVASEFTALSNTDPDVMQFHAGVAQATLATGWTYPVRAGFSYGAWYYYNQTDDHWSEVVPHRQTPVQAGDGLTMNTTTDPDTLSVLADGNTLNVGPAGVSIDLANPNTWTGDITLNGADLNVGDADSIILGDGSDMTLSSDGAKVTADMGAASDFAVQLGDAAGARKFLVEDSGGNTMASTDSDGNGVYKGNVTVGANGEVRMTEFGMQMLFTATGAGVTANRLAKISATYTASNAIGLTGENDVAVVVTTETKLGGQSVWCTLPGSIAVVTYGGVAGAAVGMLVATACDGSGKVIPYTEAAGAGLKCQKDGWITKVVGDGTVHVAFNPSVDNTVMA